MNLSRLLAAADTPYVFRVVVSPADFEEIRKLPAAQVLDQLARIGIQASPSLPDGWAVGLDHEGRVIRIWAP